jgi:3-oxoacyl-[acyl-carrier-protein] synthase-1
MNNDQNRQYREVFVIADNIYSPLGRTTSENFDNLANGKTALAKHHILSIADHEFTASLFEQNDPVESGDEQLTKFERLLIATIADAMSRARVDAGSERTGLIISTTKGNIGLLENAVFSHELKKRIALHTSASLIRQHFGFTNQPVIVSNACISGAVALLHGSRMIQAGHYDQVVVAGADVISKFIFSGFEAFHALSSEPCRPFDKDRTGLNLGEGAAAVVLSSKQASPDNIKMLGGAVSDDANHISGPSRTGEELGYAIQTALRSANVSASQIDLISAHGTATTYNDDMEAKAITFAGLKDKPVTGLKGSYGHTLGAASLIESVVSMNCLQRNVLLPTTGFSATGTIPIHINTKMKNTALNLFLKTASGFGGCNAALVFGK